MHGVACASVRRIVILDPDHLRATALHRAALQVFPGATVMDAASPREVEASAAAHRSWLLITSLDVPGIDVLALLARGGWAEERFCHRLVVTARREQRILLLLASDGLDGVFDPGSEGVDRLRMALREINTGHRYVSPGVLEALVKWRSAPNSVARLLTPREQVVLSVIGDGCDDDAAAEALHLRPSTVQSVRRNLHRKLGISHKGELVRLAVQHGFVQFTADGVVQPGFACPVQIGADSRPAFRTGETLMLTP